MLYLKLSPDRVWIINEYWIFFPLALAIDIAIILHVKKHRRNQKQVEQVKKQLRDYKIFHIAMGNFLEALKIRGGEDLIDYIHQVDYPDIIIGSGLRYLDNTRMRNIINSLFKKKAINGVIFITRTALAYLVEQYGLELFAFPFPVQDVLGVSAWKIFGKKLAAAACFAISLPMLVLAQGPASIIIGIGAGSFSIAMVATTNDPGFKIIGTTLISGPLSAIKRRMPDQAEVVTVDLNFEKAQKITMSKISDSSDCLLPHQMIVNQKCRLRSSEISDIVANVDTPLTYDDVVNMQDVTNLHTLEFSDKFEVTPNPNPKPTSNYRLRGTKNYRNRGKTANFLEKFGDPKVIPDTEQWDSNTITPSDALRIQDKEL